MSGRGCLYKFGNSQQQVFLSRNRLVDRRRIAGHFRFLQLALVQGFSHIVPRNAVQGFMIGTQLFFRRIKRLALHPVCTEPRQAGFQLFLRLVRQLCITIKRSVANPFAGSFL